MPDKWGRPTASDWMGLGLGVSGVVSQQKQEAIQAEKQQWARDDRAQSQTADEIAVLIRDQGENTDLSNYSDVDQLRGATRFAQWQQEQYQTTEAFQQSEREKMSTSAARLKQHGLDYQIAKSQGDQAGMENAIKAIALRDRRNDVSSFEPIDDGGKEYKVYFHDGTNKVMPRPTPAQMDQIASIAFDAKGHIAAKAAEEQLVREQNKKVLNNPKTWVNDKGEQLAVQENYLEYNPDTGARKYVNKYWKGLTPVSEEQVRASGFRRGKIIEEGAKVAKAKAETKASRTKIGGAGKIVPGTGKRLEGGGIAGVDTMGFGAIAPAEDAGKLVLKKQGKPADAKISVRDAKTGKTREMFVTDVHKNLKEAKAILKSAKDDSGNTFVLPNLDQLQGASLEEKETVLAKVERLAGDMEQSQAVRTAAKQVLNYLEALGITQTAKQAIGGGDVPGTGGNNTGNSWKTIREDLIKTKQGNRTPEPATLQQ